MSRKFNVSQLYGTTGKLPLYVKVEPDESEARADWLVILSSLLSCPSVDYVLMDEFRIAERKCVGADDEVGIFCCVHRSPSEGESTARYELHVEIDVVVNEVDAARFKIVETATILCRTTGDETGARRFCVTKLRGPVPQ